MRKFNISSPILLLLILGTIMTFLFSCKDYKTINKENKNSNSTRKTKSKSDKDNIKSLEEYDILIRDIISQLKKMESGDCIDTRNFLFGLIKSVREELPKTFMQLDEIEHEGLKIITRESLIFLMDEYNCKGATQILIKNIFVLRIDAGSHSYSLKGRHPAIEALINMGIPGAGEALERLKENITRKNEKEICCYIIYRVLGDLTPQFIKNAIKKETDETKKKRLQDSLIILDKVSKTRWIKWWQKEE